MRDSIVFQVLSNFIDGTFHISNSDNDPGRRLTHELTRRDAFYTDLLDSYVKITKKRNRLKEFHKWIFFWIVMISGIVGIRIMYSIVKEVLGAQDEMKLIESIPVIITSLVAFISTIIVIPTTITQFLFNTKEDDNITKIIEHTQNHDASGRDFFKDRFNKHEKANETNKGGFSANDNDNFNAESVFKQFSSDSEEVAN